MTQSRTMYNYRRILSFKRFCFCKEMKLGIFNNRFSSSWSTIYYNKIHGMYTMMEKFETHNRKYFWLWT